MFFFDVDDKGELLYAWSIARVPLIPKGPDSPADGRQPLTMMLVIFRLWAKRWAEHYISWMVRWAPPGLFGGPPERGADSALWQIL